MGQIFRYSHTKGSVILEITLPFVFIIITLKKEKLGKLTIIFILFLKAFKYLFLHF